MKANMRTKKIKMSAFTLKVISIVRKIPRGKVATYGQVARLAGKPHGARGVGWILNSCSETHDLPWQRVLNSQGKISFSPRTDQFKQQKRLLQKEGVRFLTANSLDLGMYRWSKDIRPEKRSRGTPTIFG